MKIMIKIAGNHVALNYNQTHINAWFHLVPMVYNTKINTGVSINARSQINI